MKYSIAALALIVLAPVAVAEQPITCEPVTRVVDGKTVEVWFDKNNPDERNAYSSAYRVTGPGAGFSYEWMAGICMEDYAYHYSKEILCACAYGAYQGQLASEKYKDEYWANRAAIVGEEQAAQERILSNSQ